MKKPIKKRNYIDIDKQLTEIYKERKQKYIELREAGKERDEIDSIINSMDFQDRIDKLVGE